jgi:hypothetical protein
MSKTALAFVLWAILAMPAGQVSRQAADSLDRKIIAIQSAHLDPGRHPESETTVVAPEVELESFVLYEMEDEIPPRVESIDVTIDPGEISADAELFFDEDVETGNPVLDALIGGRHRLFVGGALEGERGHGRFELRSVWVDGLPVPLFLVDALVERYVKPDYPQVDLREPFQIPWGIEAISLVAGEARITY